MTRYCYFVTEGPQDVEFLIRLLKPNGLERVTKLTSLNDFWKPLVPRSFPIQDDLRKRVPVPEFLQSQDQELSIALHSATGINNLAKTLEGTLGIIPPPEFFGIGFILDADKQEEPQKRFQELQREVQQKLSELSISLPFPAQAGDVTEESPRFGVFIMPDNVNTGTLETILTQCAEVNYPKLLELAKNYISSIDSDFNERENQAIDKNKKKDLEEFNKQFGHSKATISAITSILKPGKTLQVSLQDNRWIDEKSMELNDVKFIRDFLKKITGITPIHN